METMYKNIFINMKNNEEYGWEAGRVAVDPTGFLVIETETTRKFFNLEDITNWGYDYESEADKVFKPTIVEMPDSVN